MIGTCQKCGKPAEVRVIPGGYFCWSDWDIQVGFKHLDDDFLTHDLSVANEGTEDHDN